MSSGETSPTGCMARSQGAAGKAAGSPKVPARQEHRQLQHDATPRALPGTVEPARLIPEQAHPLGLCAARALAAKLNSGRGWQPADTPLTPPGALLSVSTGHPSWPPAPRHYQGCQQSPRARHPMGSLSLRPSRRPQENSPRRLASLAAVPCKPLAAPLPPRARERPPALRIMALCLASQLQ